MNTILMLTDFSDAALHAALYACSISPQLNSRKIVLFHAFQVTIPASEIPPVPKQDSMLYETSMSSLRSLHDKLLGLVPPEVIISYRATNADLVSALNIVTTEELPDLIVMGINEKSRWEKILFGDNTKRVVNNSQMPVLIVPLKAEIRPIIHAVLACDFKDVAETMPVQKLKTILDELQVSLSIVNVDYDNNNFSPDTPLSTTFLHNEFAIYHPVYNYVTAPDTITGIIDFAIADKASIIIIIAKNHGFFEGIFHNSVTRRIASQAPIPLLVLQGK